jgi:phosphatidylserine/phosphatidylglycerophosphate/cardiolipin synthase-like enzyme
MTKLHCIALAAGLGLIPFGAHADPSVQVGFSPEGSARQLVLETIGGARDRIQMLAYAFQAPDIMQALVEASKRGVSVQVVVDKKRNLNKPSKKAMDFAVRGGVQLRTNDHYHIHHDKTIIVDGETVQTGSFNYAPSAETLNSENVVVIRGMPEVARQYVAHWQSRWDLGQPYTVPDRKGAGTP